MFLDKFVLHGLLGAATLPLTALSAASLIDSAWAVVRGPARGRGGAGASGPGAAGRGPRRRRSMQGAGCEGRPRPSPAGLRPRTCPPPGCMRACPRLMAGLGDYTLL